MTEDASNSLPNKRSTEQSNQDAVLQRILNAETENIPDFTQSVLAQLRSDLENPLPCQYDLDFVSTYYDQQFHLEQTDTALLRQRVENFEKHLPACAPCHTVLGDIAEMSDLYRHYLYRQEEKLASFDISAQIIATLQNETAADKIVPLSAAGAKRKAWLPVALGSVAAAMFILVISNPLSPSSAPLEKASVDVGALEEALKADSVENRLKNAAIPQVDYSVNVMYETPEAYLFSSESDELMTEAELLEPNADLSAVMLKD